MHGNCTEMDRFETLINMNFVRMRDNDDLTAVRMTFVFWVVKLV